MSAQVTGNPRLEADAVGMLFSPKPPESSKARLLVRPLQKSHRLFQRLRVDRRSKAAGNLQWRGRKHQAVPSVGGAVGGQCL